MVTEFGIVIFAMLMVLKASFPIVVTVFGIIVFLLPRINLFEEVSIIALQLSLLSYTALLGFTDMFSSVAL